jgi:hypothetical protein
VCVYPTALEERLSNALILTLGMDQTRSKYWHEWKGKRTSLFKEPEHLKLSEWLSVCSSAYSIFGDQFGD